MKLVELLKRIERIDQLIRLKATGTPKRLAEKLEISERSVHRIIDTMKNMGAPIYYCLTRQSYCYEDDVEFKYGFYIKKGEAQAMVGGHKPTIPFFLAATLQ